MHKFIIISAALLATTAPAHAQLLGGGLGGGIGGSIGGTLGGGIGTIGSPMDSVGSATGGTLRGAAETTGSQSVNRKSGQVHASRSAQASGAGSLGQTVSTPDRTIDGAISGGGSAGGSGSADAQLIGTDAARGVVGSARSTAGAARGTASGLASGAVQAGRGTASAAGSIAGNAAATGSAAGGSAMATGNAAGSGSLAVTKGASVLAPDGERIGTVRKVFTDARGQVEQVLVKVDGKTAMLPASSFTANGSAVTSAMTEGQIKQEAARQEKSQGQSHSDTARP